MKSNMNEILNLSEVYPKIKSQSLPITTTYKLSKLFTAVQSEKSFYDTQIDSIIQQFGKRGEDGNLLLTDDKTGVQIDTAQISAAQEKINELMSIEVNLPDITFTLDELQKVELTVEEFSTLMKFIAD